MQYIKGHDDTKLTYCHYHNNDKFCPYEKNGCKFSHSTSPQCRFGRNCYKTLCQFRHENTSEAFQEQTISILDMNISVESSDSIVKDKNNCRLCKIDIPAKEKMLKCEECDKLVCVTCSKETLTEDTDWFMCAPCQQ